MARGYGEPVGNEYGSDDNRDRWRNDERERSSWRSGEQGTRERDDERGFFQRAGDEIRSWFEDEGENRRPGRDYGRDYERGDFGRSTWDRGNYSRSGSQGGGWVGASRDRDRGGFSDRDRERSYGRIGRGGSDYRNEDRSEFGGTAQGGRFGHPGGNREHDRERGFGPSRSSSFRNEPRDRQDFGGFRDEADFRSHRRDHPQSWGEANRGENESLGYGEFRGTLGGFGNQTFGSSQDDHYRSWRDRQMNQLDQDYGDYCREREQQFNQDFDSWRRNRQSQSPTATSTSPDLGSSSNAGTGTTTASATGSAGEGTTPSAEPAGNTSSRPSSRSRS